MFVKQYAPNYLLSLKHALPKLPRFCGVFIRFNGQADGRTDRPKPICPLNFSVGVIKMEVKKSDKNEIDNNAKKKQQKNQIGIKLKEKLHARGTHGIAL